MGRGNKVYATTETPNRLQPLIVYMPSAVFSAFQLLVLRGVPNAQVIKQIVSVNVDELSLNV